MSVKNTITRSCDSKNENTQAVYSRSAAKFGDWCGENGFSDRQIKSDPVGVIQKYADCLQEYNQRDKLLSAATIHTYLAPVCHAYGVTMDKISKPLRTIDDISRSRKDVNRQGDREEQQTCYERLVTFQRNVGIRRSELAKLRTSDITRDAQGRLCVLVRRGKGGKRQLQRVLDEKAVMDVIQTSKGDKVFSPEEMNNHIDLHAIRAEVAKKAYQMYCDELKIPGNREQLMRDIVTKYRTENTKHSRSGEERFRNSMIGTYKLRGSSIDIAKRKGLPLEYDKLALMAVSVFHLAHWRNNVTVTNYMLA